MAKLHPPVSEKDHQIGQRGAPITLVEYGDYQCPHCGEAYPLVKRLLEEEDGHFLFVFRNFPITESHPAAYMAAVAAEAAGRQGKFWEMHNLIFEHQAALHGNSFMRFAEQLGLDLQRFEADCNNRSTQQKVDADLESGLRSGVNGTPSFFVNNELLQYDGTYGSLQSAVTTV